MYQVSKLQLDYLNKIVGEVGGPIPSEVSDALAAMQAATDPAEKQKQFDKAVEANKKNGAAWGAVQQWHDVAKTQPIEDDPEPGPEPDPGPPVGSVVAFPDGNPNNTAWSKFASNLHQGVIYGYAGSGKKKCSFSISSGGYPCSIGFAPGVWAATQTGGTPWVESPDGAWTVYIMFSADPGRVQDVRLDIFEV